MTTESQGASCRFCATPLRHTFADLGSSPLCESFLTRAQLNEMEPFYPLHAWVCERCFLVQLEQYVSPEHIFREYAYFSSFSQAWLDHAREYCTATAERFALGAESLVIELASNDGYLLVNFVERGIPVLGVEPAHNVAEVAIGKGVPTRTEFFGRSYAEQLAAENLLADLVVANNVLAQVPDLNSFVAGIAAVLKPTGVVTIEFPHLLRTIEGNQFDQIYHEHFSYFSLATIERIFAAHGLEVFDVESLWTHGGSLRVYGQLAAHAPHPKTPGLDEHRRQEAEAGVEDLDTYAKFGDRVRNTKWRLLDFLISAKREGKQVIGYGAPGKGNTLLNYCGIRTDFLDYTVDRNPYKHGRFTPGTRIPIHPPERIADTKPDYILILPWNLEREIKNQLAYTREWGARFVVPIPEVDVL